MCSLYEIIVVLLAEVPVRNQLIGNVRACYDRVSTVKFHPADTGNGNFPQIASEGDPFSALKSARMLRQPGLHVGPLSLQPLGRNCLASTQILGK